MDNRIFRNMVSGVEGVFCREVNTTLGKKIVIKTHDGREYAAKVNDFIEKKLDKAINNIYPSISIDFKDCLKKRITRINFADRPEYFEFYLDYSGDVNSSKRLGGYEIKYSYKFEGQSVSCDIEYIWHE